MKEYVKPQVEFVILLTENVAEAVSGVPGSTTNPFG